jgi:hypothetical protein
MSYPKNTAMCIRYLFPDSNPEIDWSVSIRVGGVATIDHWNNAIGTKPTESEITAVSDNAEKSEMFRFIREKRNRILLETDWMANSDVIMSDAWKKYRQDLRDLPASNSDPSKIVFPTKPE